ncbi:MAG: polyprenyl synthetase family protein [Bacteriovorax sp.]|nr:polyprenyl synthetase family protein [Bacteriovorax sp.]
MSPLEIENTLSYHLDQLLPHHDSRKVYEYAILPGGKLFRPNLVWATLLDINPVLYSQSLLNKNCPHALLASAVEFHHSYSLIHDDLPCMDNDTIRRGKACTHIAFGQWQALLAGDGLINLSYQLLAKSNHARTLEVIRFFSWALGPKGLIQGQVLDLSEEMTKSFKNTLRTHELKTARLIQVAILGSFAFSALKNTILEKKLWKFSKLLGINFQLIDDLSELSEEKLSEHELAVNPWLKHTEESYLGTLKSLRDFNELALELELTNTKIIISEYYQKMLSIILSKQDTIESHLSQKRKIDLIPVILLLKTFS